VDTSLSPLDVLHSTQSIERALGRTKKSSLNAQPSTLNLQRSTLNPSPLYSDRPIDIDIIRAFDDHGEEIFINHPSPIPNDQLTIPHPLWQERDFVKVPLAEIMP
jgi:2-amino-4-hydroxy-6-hydroxymethyldihydropteridine diphosphokinase